MDTIIFLMLCVWGWAIRFSALFPLMPQSYKDTTNPKVTSSSTQCLVFPIPYVVDKLHELLELEIKHLKFNELFISLKAKAIMIRLVKPQPTSIKCFALVDSFQLDLALWNLLCSKVYFVVQLDTSNGYKKLFVMVPSFRAKWRSVLPLGFHIFILLQ